MEVKTILYKHFIEDFDKYMEQMDNKDLILKIILEDGSARFLEPVQDDEIR